jgi:hypothetical protein
LMWGPRGLALLVWALFGAGLALPRTTAAQEAVNDSTAPDPGQAPGDSVVRDGSHSVRLLWETWIAMVVPTRRYRLSAWLQSARMPRLSSGSRRSK